MVVEYLSLPTFTIVIAVDDHTIAPGVVHDEGEAVVFGGLHPVGNMGAPEATVVFGQVGQDDVFLVPAFTSVSRTEVV